MANALDFLPKREVECIITSPPYMNNLAYGRDNRLRLWFLGLSDWKPLDRTISPLKSEFIQLIRPCLRKWKSVLKPGGLCVLALGDISFGSRRMSLPDLVAEIAVDDIGGYSVVWTYADAVPDDRRTRRGYSGSITDTILVLQNVNRNRSA